MAKGKDFYGTDVTEVIARACKELDASQEDLDIEVLETGSAGIFGLCKKKAHIRAKVKPAAKAAPEESGVAEKKKVEKPVKEKKVERKEPLEKAEDKPEDRPQEDKEAETPAPEPEGKKTGREKKKAAAPAGKAESGDSAKPRKSTPAAKETPPAEPVERELPAPEVLKSIEEDLVSLLEIMGFASGVTVEVVDYSVACRISGEHQDALVGSEGRTLDSLQYLLRKMMSRRLPDRMMLSLDVGNYREQRAEDLKERALQLAAQVKEDGKTQAIPALNPSERRVVHMLLQEDREIRSRSVGEGLFKKVLIYKPGKKKKSGSRKGKGRQGGRSSGNN